MSDLPLNICLVTTFYPPYHFGGDALFVQALARALADRGHCIHVIHSVDAYRLSRPEPPAVDPSPDDSRITVHRLETHLHWPAALIAHQTGRSGFYAPALRRIFSTGFDVIHYHNASLVGAPGVFPCATALKLYTPHEYWLLCPRHDLFRFGRRACGHRTCFRCTLAAGRPPQLWRLGPWFRRMLSHIDLLLAPSRFSARLHREWGYPGEIAHLPLFVPDPLTTISLPPPVQPYVFFAGRLEHCKGLQTVIPIFARQKRVRFIIAGGGSMEARLRMLAAGSPAIEFLGPLSPAAVRQQVAAALAVLLPSLVYEVSPLAVLEAFAQGTPVIVRRHGAMPELVEESGAGFCFDQEEEIMALLSNLIDAPERRTKLSHLARTAYDRLWRPAIHIDRYLALIRARRAA